MRGWAAYFMAWLLALVAAPALAGGPSHEAVPAAASPDCIAVMERGEPLAALAGAPERWRCGAATESLTAGQVAIRFPVDRLRSDTMFGTRPSIFDGLTIGILAGDRVIAEQHFDGHAMIAAHNGRLTLVPVPDLGTAAGVRPDSVVVVFHHPSTRALVADARLYPGDPTVGHAGMTQLLLAAIVCGMLLMPLAFNAAYYRVLREKFVLWHLVVSCGLLLQCLLTSGILSHFMDLPLPLFSRLTNVSFAISVASAAAFCAAFIEPDKLHPRLRTGLYLAGGQVLAVSLIDITIPNAFGAIQTVFYYLSFLPVLVLFIAVMIDASRRGSRAVRYQIIGWTPFLVVGVIRIATMVLPITKPSEAMNLFYFAMVVESIATSLGVADRFMIIRRQRDRALSRATSLEMLSERDDLTGLYNRRALEGPLGNFEAQRFTGMALFDLDHFKRVNDTHGHAVGDAVLRTVASVLDGHEDSIALRLGGEEFMLLLRGDHVSLRVERLRESIPVRIAREVTELETLVTSSAGLVEAVPGAALDNAFPVLYRKADDLLYEAKHNGRNLLASMVLRPGKAEIVADAAAA